MPRRFLKLQEAVDFVLEEEADDEVDFILLGPPPGGDDSDAEDVDVEDVTTQNFPIEISSEIEVRA